MSQDPNAPQGGYGQPGGQQGYPSAPQGGYQPAPQGYPSSPQGHGGPAPTTPPPSLATAIKLMWGMVALSVLGIVAGFLVQGEVRDQVAASPDVDPGMVDAATTIGLVFGIVFGLIGAALWVMCAVFSGRGKKWARIVATVLAALSIVGGLSGLVQGQAITLVLSLLQAALAIGILVFIWKKDSSAYFEAHAAPRY